MPQTPFDPPIDVFAVPNYSGDTQSVTQNWYITTLTQAINIDQLAAPGPGDITPDTVAPVQNPDTGGVYKLPIGDFGLSSTAIKNQPWTPTDASGASLAFTHIDTTYSQVSNEVIFTARIIYPTTSSSANAAIAGLPVAADVTLRITGMSSNNILLTPTIINNTIILTSANNSLIKNVELSGATITISGSYQSS